MNVFDFFGSAVCHQMAERSFFWGSCQSPLCARCTAIEGGIILGVIFYGWQEEKTEIDRFRPLA